MNDEEQYFQYHESGLLFWKQKPCIAVNIGEIAGHKDSLGYVIIGFKGKLVKAHRLIWKMLKGYWPENIDHINGMRSDNRIENLRECTQQENCRNRRQDYGMSAYKGVGYRKDGARKKRWVARITVKRKTIHIGLYITEIEAAKAYDIKAAELFGEYAVLNFGDES